MKKMDNTKRMEVILERLQKYSDWQDPRALSGLTRSQLSLLLALSEYPGCGVQDTARRLDLTAPTISIGVRRLEKMGLIERAADPDDQRAVCLYLTARGRRVAARARAVRAQKLTVMLGVLTPEEQESLLMMLEKAVPEAD
jgi:DNA-binding MarR family transcriptional regulator